jgi:pimeloyl-ACP methyl ester carboxylesterase
VPIDPGPFRGVLPLPFSSLKAASAVLRNPANKKRSVMLTYDQLRYAFAKAVDEAEAKRLYDTFPIPASGAPLFQAAFANLNPSTEAQVDSKNPARGPLKLISGEKDHTVPWAIANASSKRQRRNKSVTEIEEIDDQGHSLVLDEWLGRGGPRRKEFRRPFRSVVAPGFSRCRTWLQGPRSRSREQLA